MIKAVIFDASDVLYDHSGVDEQMFELINDLSGSYKIGMITNLPEMSLKNYFSKDEIDLFDYIHTFNAAGLSKPNPKVFEYTAKQLGIEPEECLCIDDAQSNINGAIQSGMDTILYRSFSEVEYRLKQLISEVE